MRVCRVCGNSEQEVAIPKNRGLLCNRCRYQAEKDQAKERTSEWAAANRERKRERERARHKDNPDQRFGWNIKRYGISVADYRLLYEQQGGLCAVCGNPETAVDRRTGAVRRLAVDHDHTTGQVRGLLCNWCNPAIGYLRDDPHLARQVAAYLELYVRPVHPALTAATAYLFTWATDVGTEVVNA